MNKQAIKQIAETGTMENGLWHSLSDPQRADLVRAYFSHDARKWNQTKAQYDIDYAARNGSEPHCYSPG